VLLTLKIHPLRALINVLNSVNILIMDLFQEVDVLSHDLNLRALRPPAGRSSFHPGRAAPTARRKAV